MWLCPEFSGAKRSAAPHRAEPHTPLWKRKLRGEANRNTTGEANPEGCLFWRVAGSDGEGEAGAN
ncbi:MAG: hypothetical protein LBL24_10470 [Bacteroidales bacterium]|nr:hypothetical protein [Bacteroidales bacterium]